MMPKDAHGHGAFRRFWLTEFSVRNRVSVLVLLATVAIVGILSYNAVPKEAQPEITIPMIAVSTIYPGVAAADMETLVSRVIEEELHTIPEITDLTSTSIEGYSSVIAEFESDMDMDEALQAVREKLDLAKPDLPDDVEDPIISEFNFAEFPIMQVNVSGAYDLVRLKEVAEDLQERLEEIPSILEVNLTGGLEREVQVDVDLEKLQNYDLAFSDVIEAIQLENVNVPGGGIDVGSQEYLVRVDGEFDDPRTIEELVIEPKDGRPVYVRDVAAVDFGFKERDSYARLDGNPVVTLDIVKRSGENIIATSEAVKATIAAMQPEFPPSTVVKITSDMSEDIHEMVSSLENNIISGLILVVAVLLFFLGIRNASLVGISIPTSMLLSFIVMRMLDFSMNMVVLFSLILALGMLVDNAIVVVENIYRFMEEGYDRVTAATRATAEVAMPVIASTLTTLGAFLPMAFWPGIVGEFMGFLPKTLIITLSSSLFVALVIVPTLAAMTMKLENSPREPLTRAARRTLIGAAVLALLVTALANPLTAVLFAVTGVALVALHRTVMAGMATSFQHRVLPRVISWYEQRLRWALDHRRIVLGGTAGVFVTTVVLFGFLNAGIEFFPESIPPAQASIVIDVPSGTSASFTDGIAKQIEAKLPSYAGAADMETTVATVSGDDRSNPVFGGGGEGRVTVSFVDFEDRAYDTFETIERLQADIASEIAGADVAVSQPQNGPPSGAPINLEIAGQDPERLKALGDEVIRILATSPVGPKLVGLESDMAQGRPELVVEVDRERAAMYGLSTAAVGTLVRTAIQGAEAAKYRVGKDEYDIVVRLAASYRGDLNALRDLTVVNDDGVQIPLNSVARWRVDEGFGSIQRKDLDRVVTVSADVRSGENSNAVLGEVQQTLAAAGFADDLPRGYTMSFTGQQEDQQESQEFLFGAFLAALLLIGFILVSQFNSVVKPLIIMTSVVMSTVGVLLGLILFRMPFGIIMTGVGVISLAGVVVNNAIVLIDYIDVLRERDGLDRREALVRAGMTRFRPVVLTAITTVLGLVPLATGFNFDFIGLFTSLSPDIYWGGEQAAWWGPMAIAVIAGLSFATVLTLVLVPVMYSIVDDGALFFRRHYTRAPEPDAAGFPTTTPAGVAGPDAERDGLPEPEPDREEVGALG
ncbi:MAG: efflux RND transporter permease subunit [Longimicrobiales bacterium]